MIKKAKQANGVVKVTFSLPLGEAPGPVSVVGDFNGWDPSASPLVKRANGTRSASVALPAGAAYAFKYLTTDGEWHTDPTADGSSTNEYGEVNSVVET